MSDALDPRSFVPPNVTDPVLADLSEALEGRYTIESRLGEGGMAVVYLAQDLKHGRAVAVKVLRPEIAAMLGAERFLREIQVTAFLQHPNILPIYDSGSAQDFLYYVMPHMEGGSIRTRLEAEGQLDLEEAVELTRGAATALQYAHDRGVIHRDIKPENILIQDGVPIVSDFGVALAMSSAGESRLTLTGLTLGTPSYMSPEQSDPKADADERTDTYSLATVLFEMLTGEPPYLGRTAFAIISKTLTDPVPSARRLRSDIPGSLDRVLAQAMAKSPGDRFAKIRDFRDALTTGEDPAEGRHARSVVVLPFANQDPDPSNEYFSDGFTEEVITDLSRLRGLRVISASSSMQLKGIERDSRTLGRDLGCSHLLRGTVRMVGFRLRAVAELVDTSSDEVVWAEDLEGTLDEVFEIQDRLSLAVAGALGIEPSEGERELIARRHIPDVQAYDYYLQARESSVHLTETSMGRALEQLERAAELVGENALLYASMGDVHLYGAAVDPGEREARLEEAEAFARRALTVDPECHRAYGLLGMLQTDQGRMREGLANLARAVELEPSNAETLCWATQAHATVGWMEEAEEYARSLAHIDPLTPWSQLVLGFVDMLNGHSDSAIANLKRAYRLSPATPMFRLLYAFSLAFDGQRDAAIRLLDEVDPLPGDVTAAFAGVLRHALAGEAEEAHAAMSDDVEAHARTDPQFSWLVADCWGMLDERTQAAEWLENAAHLGFINYPFFAKKDPFLRPLRGDRRFDDALRTVRVQWEQLDAG